MFDVYVPSSFDDALKFLSREGHKTTIISHGTDLLPRIRAGELRPEVLLDLSGFDDLLRYIREDGECIRIGALTTVTDIYESPALNGPLEAFKHAAKKFGGPQIRNMATIGGNVGAASSSEDFIPILLALNAKAKLTSVYGDRILSIERLILDKRVIARRSNEIITEIFFKKPPENAWTAFDKIGRRNAMFIALVNMAVYLHVENGRIKDVRIALNRVKRKIPERAYETEKFLKGKIFTNEVLEGAKEVLERELKLTSDFRASAEYRVEVQKALLKRLLTYCYNKIRRVKVE